MTLKAPKFRYFALFLDNVALKCVGRNTRKLIISNFLSKIFYLTIMMSPNTRSNNVSQVCLMHLLMPNNTLVLF